MSLPHPITARSRLVQAALALAADRIGEERGDPNEGAQSELLEDQLDDAARGYVVAADAHDAGCQPRAYGTTVRERARDRAATVARAYFTQECATIGMERSEVVDLLAEALAAREFAKDRT